MIKNLRWQLWRWSDRSHPWKEQLLALQCHSCHLEHISQTTVRAVVSGINKLLSEQGLERRICYGFGSALPSLLKDFYPMLMPNREELGSSLWWGTTKGWGAYLASGQRLHRSTAISQHCEGPFQLPQRLLGKGRPHRTCVLGWSVSVHGRRQCGHQSHCPSQRDAMRPDLRHTLWSQGGSQKRNH